MIYKEILKIVLQQNRNQTRQLHNNVRGFFQETRLLKELIETCCDPDIFIYVIKWFIIRIDQTQPGFTYVRIIIYCLR